MNLWDLLTGVPIRYASADLPRDVTGAGYDSHTIRPGQVFVAIHGANADGHDYTAQARQRGAACAVSAHPVEGLPYVLVPDPRRALALMAGNFFRHPDRELSLIGVTGTNGKTSVAWLTAGLFQALGIPTGLMGTNGCRIGDAVLPSRRTTPESWEVQGLLRQMADSGCTHAVMEVSSHALALDRVHGLAYTIAAFTNLSRDHLDFHGAMEDYAAAKEAYDAAHSGFYAAANAAAAPLRTALEKAIDKFEAFQAGDRVTVTIAATQDGSAVTPAQATFTSEFGTVTTVKNAGSVQLVPATYQFDLSDGGINHVRGTVEVTAQGAAVSAPLPSGKWIKELRLGIDNQWKDGEDVPKFDETDGGATFWVPDYSYGTLYPYMVPGDGIGTAEGQMNVRVYLAGVETLPKYARSWQSKATALSRVLPGSSLEGGDVVLEARYTVDGYEQYQP